MKPTPLSRHEAGHAIVCAYYGGKVISITRGELDGAVVMREDEPLSTADGVRLVRVGIAGALAQTFSQRVRPWYRYVTGGDGACIRRGLAILGHTPPPDRPDMPIPADLLEPHARAVRGLFERPAIWAAVQRLALALDVEPKIGGWRMPEFLRGMPIAKTEGDPK